MSIFGDQMLGKLLLDVSAGILNASYLSKSQKFNVTGTKCSHYPLGHSPPLPVSAICKQFDFICPTHMRTW